MFLNLSTNQCRLLYTLLIFVGLILNWTSVLTNYWLIGTTNGTPFHKGFDKYESDKNPAWMNIVWLLTILTFVFYPLLVLFNITAWGLIGRKGFFKNMKILFVLSSLTSIFNTIVLCILFTHISHQKDNVTEFGYSTYLNMATIPISLLITAMSAYLLMNPPIVVRRPTTTTITRQQFNNQPNIFVVVPPMESQQKTPIPDSLCA